MRRGVVLALLLPALQAWAAEATDGGEPFAWLKLGVGARQAGLGRATVALEGDAYTLNHNPAGLASLKRISLGSQTALLSADRRLEHLAFARPLDLKFWRPGLGLSISRFGLDSPVERRDTNTPQPVAQWFQSAYAFQLGMASWIGDGPSIHSSAGLALRFVSESIGEASGEGMALDLGSLYRAKSWLTLGFSLKNLLSRNSWSTGHSETSPLSGRLGAAARLWERRILVALELEKSANQDYRTRAGIEWLALPGLLSLRAGLDHDRLAAGLGLAWNFSGNLASLDYAFRTDPVVAANPEHRFSLSLEFDLEDAATP